MLFQFKTVTTFLVATGPIKKYVPLFPLTTKRPQWHLPEAFSSTGWKTPTLPAFPHRKKVLSSFLWPYSEPAPTGPCLPCTKDPRVGHSTKSGGVSWERSRVGKSPPLTHACFWLIFSLSPTSTPSSFSAELLSNLFIPQPVLKGGLPQPRCSTWPCWTPWDSCVPADMTYRLHTLVQEVGKKIPRIITANRN